jgi:hypothetical protein
MIAGRRADRLEFWRSCSLSIAASIAGSSEPGRTQPRSPPCCAVAPCENCWASAGKDAPRRSCSITRSALRLASSACSTLSIGMKISATRASVLPMLVRMRDRASSISASDTSTCGRTRRRTILVQARVASICWAAIS